MDKKWAEYETRKVENYLKLYSSFLMFETFFIIAHRSFVSLYDLSVEIWHHYNYRDTVRYVSLVTRESATKENLENSRSDTKKYSQIYKIGVVVGANQIHFLRINAHMKETFPV